MAGFAAYQDFDAVGLAALVRRGEISPAELLAAAVARMEAVNPALNAVVHAWVDRARADIARGLPDGPLKGVPFLLKDLGVTMEGVALTNGSRAFANHVSDRDAIVVERYRRAGLVIFGRTNAPELGLTVTTEPQYHGPTRNPWDLTRSAGGSSGGAAAAVAAGMVPAAQASDGGGSIRIPASACGLVGLKPSRGRVPAGPPHAESWAGMSVTHALTRTVRDSAALLDVVAGPFPGDAWAVPGPGGPFLDAMSRAPEPQRIAFCWRSPFDTEVEPACRDAVERAASLCAGLGHRVEEAWPALDMETMRKAATTIMAVDTHRTLKAHEVARGRPIAQDELERATVAIAGKGATLSAADYVEAVDVLHRTGRAVGAFMTNHDLLLCPVLAAPPAPLGTVDMMATDLGAYGRLVGRYSPFCQLANATGQPAIALPLYWTEHGLPVGVQFVARFGAEATLLRIARQLEQAEPWAGRRPALA